MGSCNEGCKESSKADNFEEATAKKATAKKAAKSEDESEGERFTGK